MRGTDVRSAVTADVDMVIDILAESSRWVTSKGINQWPDRFPRELLITSVEREELFVADSNQHTVGTITLQWSDPIFWGARAVLPSCIVWPCAEVIQGLVWRSWSGPSRRLLSTVGGISAWTV